MQPDPIQQEGIGRVVSKASLTGIEVLSAWQKQMRASPVELLPKPKWQRCPNTNGGSCAWATSLRCPFHEACSRAHLQEQADVR